jgi:uncharacterized protein
MRPAMRSNCRMGRVPAPTAWVTVLAIALSGSAGVSMGGEPRFTNRLIDSNNPYLLLHAHNPVDWYPWGPEAIAKARKENKPIFLSIGYSTCYWCHVAERTLYSDPAIAALMNAWFVNVKVDREQRPDLDEIYMLARRLISGDGGWPNNIFLTPALKPFYAGSYFPPTTDESGRPGFPEVLRAVNDRWTSKRNEVLALADQVDALMRSAQAQMAGGDSAPVAPAQWLARARDDYLLGFDAKYGGQRTLAGGMKFPRAPMLRLLLVDYRSRANADVLRALTTTLDAMAFGGIYDHLGGGFHRYSTESTWSVPHFEKMLYDNAQLLQLYAESYKTTGNPLYRHVAQDIAAYLLADMMAPEGGFYTAQDAQVDGVEGATYRWRREEIERILGLQDDQRFFRVYELRPVPEIAGATGRHAGDVGGVLRIRIPVEETLKSSGFNDPVAMIAALKPLRQQLLAARTKRAQPLRDEKLNTDLNGLAIAAFVVAGQVLQEPRYLEQAKRAAERIWAHAYDPATGRLMHQLFRDRTQTAGFLADYALFGRALMALYRATGDQMWHARAASLGDGLIKGFLAANGALVMTAGEHDLLIPVESGGDRVYPSGTSAAIDLLLELSEAVGGERYGDAAGKILRYHSARLDRYPDMWATAVVAVNTNNAQKAMAGTAVASTSDRSPPSAIARAGSPLQTADHVRVSAEARQRRDADAIVVTLAIDQGYHINANPASYDYLVPTTVRFEQISALQIKYPTPIPFKPTFADQPLNVYEGTPEITALFPRGTLRQSPTIHGTVRVQACNDQVCLPPSDLPVSIRLSDRVFNPAK